MKNTVFDPAIMFISNDDLASDTKRDEFLDHLTNNLNNIHRYKVTRVYWTDQLEACLWDQQSPIWGNRTLKLQLMSMLGTLFRPYIDIVNCDDNSSVCSIQPRLSYECSDAVCTYFLQMTHLIINKNENILFCLGLRNKLLTGNYSFSCDCHGFRINPEVINNPEDWLKHIDLENNYWPNNANEGDKFRKALDIIRIRDFNDKPFLYRFNFSSQFIKDLIPVTNDKSITFKNITKKLTISSDQARQDINLKDEYIAQTKEYRFRVNLARIHYNVSNDVIEFLRYYPDGHHDDGL